jgi:hypothetical protein
MVCAAFPPDFLPTHKTSHPRRRAATRSAGLNGFVEIRKPCFPLMGAGLEQMGI